MLAGTLLSSGYCCRLPVDVLVEIVAPDVPGLTALVARGEQPRCERIICDLAHSGADSARRAAATVASPTRTRPALAPANSAAPGRGGIMPRLETRKGGG